MVFGSKLVICVIFTFVQFVRSDKIFPNQYLGNYLSDKEYKSREKCDTKVCLLDADRLIYAATRNSSIKPCDDFKTFAMGEFYLHPNKNDRYPWVGFLKEVDHLSDKRYRNVLKLPIKKEDLKVHKFLKSHFRKCTDTGHTTKHGGDEMLAYLNALGGSPLIANETWDEAKFDVATLLELDPFAIFFLTDIKISRCNVVRYFGPLKNRIEPVCLKRQSERRDNKIDLLEILQKYKFDKIKKQKAVEDYEEFIMIRNSDIKNSNSSEKVIRIKNLSKTFPNPNINWLKLINNRLLSASQITDDEEISIEDPDYLNQTLTFLSKMDKGVIANAFTANYLLYRSDMFFTKYLHIEDAWLLETKPGRQRFQTCISNYRALSFQLALDSLSAKEKFDQEIQNAAKEFVMEAVADYESGIEEYSTYNSDQKLLQDELLEKLRNIQLQVMFHDEELNDSIVDTFYDGLDFDETMSFFDLQFAMESFHFKVENERKSSGFRTLKAGKFEYFIEENILVVPAKYTLPPFFVPNRSRFFNVATLHSKVHEQIAIGINRYVANKIIFENQPLYLDHHFDVADKYYVEWEENGGKELQLSPFKLTNRQMLWLCIANVNAMQYQSKQNTSNDHVDTLLSDNYHLSFKGKKLFREAFQCEELTEQEEDILSDYRERYPLSR